MNIDAVKPRLATLARDLIAPTLEPFGIKRQGRGATFGHVRPSGDRVEFAFRAFPMDLGRYSFTNVASMTPSVYDRWRKFAAQHSVVVGYESFWLTDIRADCAGNTAGNLWEFNVDDEVSTVAFREATGSLAHYLTSLLDPAELLAVISAPRAPRFAFDHVGPGFALAIARIWAGDQAGLHDSLRSIQSQARAHRDRVFTQFLELELAAMRR